jgi:hypothetical protein
VKVNIILFLGLPVSRASPRTAITLSFFLFFNTFFPSVIHSKYDLVDFFFQKNGKQQRKMQLLQTNSFPVRIIFCHFSTRFLDKLARTTHIFVFVLSDGLNEP